MTERKWKVGHPSDEATTEFAFLFQNEDVKTEVKRLVDMLATQQDPRHPSFSASLTVDELEYDSPGWFRLKIPRYDIRIIFRLLIVREEQLVEIQRLQAVPDDVKEYYIEIMQAGYRKDVYGEELRQRYRKYRDDENEEA